MPSTDEVFDPDVVPGLDDDVRFRRWGGFIELDFRDLASGPRAGGYYAITGRQYDDVNQEKHAFSQVLLQAQQYIPYFVRKQSS